MSYVDMQDGTIISYGLESTMTEDCRHADVDVIATGLASLRTAQQCQPNGSLGAQT